MVKISAQSEHFLFSSFKSVLVNFSFFNLFLDTWIRNPDPDSEYGSGSRIQAQFECGSTRIRIRIRNTDLFYPPAPGRHFFQSTFFQVSVFSIRRFVPFGIFLQPTFFPVDVLTFRRFVPVDVFSSRRFLLYDVLY